MGNSVAPRREDCHSCPSNHLSGGSWASARVQTLLSPVTTTGSSRGIPKPPQANSQLSSLLHVLCLPLLNGHISPERYPGDVLTKCLNHINRLLWRWRSRSSTLSSFCLSSSVPLSLSQAPQQRKLTGSACICFYNCSGSQGHACDIYVNRMLSYVK